MSEPAVVRTLLDRSWDTHRIRDLGNGVALLAIDRIFLHERTGSLALKALREADRRVYAPESVFCTIDHIVDTTAGRRHAPQGRQWETALAHWRQLRSDETARFDARIDMDTSALAPMETWGTSPQHAVPVTAAIPTLEMADTTSEAYHRAIDYMGLQPGQALTSLPIDAAFIGSCTNSRLSDLRRITRS